MTDDLPKPEPAPERYWGRAELEEARAKSKANGDADTEIDYPVCAGCGKRHAPESFLVAALQAVCSACGWTGQCQTSCEACEAAILGDCRLETNPVKPEKVDHRGPIVPAHSPPRPTVHKNPAGRWCRGV